MLPNHYNRNENRTELLEREEHPQKKPYSLPHHPKCLFEDDIKIK